MNTLERLDRFPSVTHLPSSYRSPFELFVSQNSPEISGSPEAAPAQAPDAPAPGAPVAAGAESGNADYPELGDIINFLHNWGPTIAAVLLCAGAAAMIARSGGLRIA